jgi:hypothetical protein
MLTYFASLVFLLIWLLVLLRCRLDYVSLLLFSQVLYQILTLYLSAFRKKLDNDSVTLFENNN